MKLGFIGAGKMATAMARGLAERGILAPSSMAACDVSNDARGRFTAATQVPCYASPDDVTADCDAVVLAVKPQVAEEAVRAMAAACAGKLIISIAAGVTLRTLAGWSGSERIIRVMPNTPLTVGKGASVFACAPDVRSEDRAFAEEVFGALGIVYELPEEKIDAVTALSGSGPAYVFETIQGLVDAGIAVGLPADVALDLTVQTVAGAAEMLRQGLGTPDALRVAVTSPGGTTAAGLAVFASAGYRELLAAVVRAARDRGIELGRDA